ncbi:CsbD family protein [Arthrobacter sp. 92]|jgi:uncharacterized protein YjbJ (UPF0337 family)|uniref:CsbD family protein n=1 Tax=Arthrobacter sp. 92 TaxID=3418175 RepID=UPI003CFFBEB2
MMAIDDKARYTVIHHIGAAKEGAGTLTGNGGPESPGEHHQAPAMVRGAGEQVKDAAADVGEDL